MVGCDKTYIRSPSAILKIGETVCIAVTFGLFRGIPLTFGDVNKTVVSVGTDADFFAGGVMVAALIISPLFFFLYLFKLANIQQTVLELAINFLFAAFLFICASVCMAFYHSANGYWAEKRSDGITMGIFCYVSAAFYTLDSLLACRNYCIIPNESSA
ncbi:hypothetical protein Pcinc_028369 [Petrolisthes cinctipes]|uniref:MARVEL domain-containing protein n=1 Tax=Petrolisthes cinctipes TaxID=88211 RepID=A0AAE1K908_PETCI|nr:hypothetical protein Pcinc_030042 [Petrolisthes cinctipes]KAK3866078.1 hypothetical protein Pcinc_028369 [Petrolisthes cinctipes]